MPELRSIELIGTTNSGGAATIEAPSAIFGTLFAVQWVDGSFADGVDGTLTVQNVGGQGVAQTLLTLTDANNDAFYYPRHQVHDNAGAGLTTDGTRIAQTMPLIAGVLRLTVASGGNAQTGGCVVYYYHKG
jgi:hypothetical protein